MALACPSCEEAAAEYVGMADDGRNEMKCTACGHHWLLGAKPVSPRAVVAKPARPASTRAPRTAGAGSAGSGSTARGSSAGRTSGPTARSTATSAPPAVVRFPTLDDVPAEHLQRLAALKAAWPRQRPRPDPYAGDFRRLHELMFSRAGLPHTEPGQLKDFVSSDVLALSGNTTSFAREWRRLGDRDASERFRGVVEYLLRGESGEDEDGQTDDPPLEDRFTALAEQRSPYAMGGVREPVLMHVLTVARPERFLPLLTVDSGSGGEGKRDVARSVLGVEIPAVDRTRHTVGRVACRSNDLLVDALGAGFRDLDDAAAFLLWAHTQA